MRKLLIAAAAATFALAGTAQASVVYSNNFDGENGGNTALNYNGFTGLTVTGNVDLTKSGDYYPCAGATGSCVDLDGTTGPGQLASTDFFSFNAGDLVTLAFDLAGNSRNADSDDYYFGVTFSGSTLAQNVMVDFGTGAFSFGDESGTSITNVASILGTDPFGTRFFSFTAGNAGSLQFFVGTNSADNVGPVLDNLSLDVSGAVPEPATWAMMIAGFGLAGGALRRRRAGSLAAA